MDKGKIYIAGKGEAGMLFPGLAVYGPGGGMPPSDAVVFIFGHSPVLGLGNTDKGIVWKKEFVGHFMHLPALCADSGWSDVL